MQSSLYCSRGNILSGFLRLNITHTQLAFSVLKLQAYVLSLFSWYFPDNLNSHLWWLVIQSQLPTRKCSQRLHQSDDNKWGTVFFTDPDFLFNSALNVLWAASANVRKTKITTLYHPILSYLSYSILIQHQKRALMISPFMAKLATNPKGFALSQQLSQGDYKWAPESHQLPWKINMFGSNGLFDPKH